MKLYKDYNSHHIMNRLNNLPNELYRKVYEFIKPTLSDHTIEKVYPRSSRRTHWSTWARRDRC